MRIALIADIHGNTAALDAVLADSSRQDVDRVVCLGDLAIGGPDPGGAVDRIAELRCVTVKGNADAAALDVPEWWGDPAAAGAPEGTQRGVQVAAWGAAQLSADRLRYLAGLAPTAVVDLGGGVEMLAFHGSPRADTDILEPHTAPDELDAMLGGAGHPVLAGGHTHVAMVRRHGKQTLVNPGSVGMPFREYGFAGEVGVLPHAAYAIVTASGPELSIDLRQVAVDQDALAALVESSGMPHGAWWLGLRR